MAQSNDFSGCMVLNTVRAARALNRRYDERLRPFGVTVAQFAVLAMLDQHRGETISALADRIAMDRTSLSRNLALLERKRLVRKEPTSHGNARSCELTDEGEALLARLIPEWRAAQAELANLIAPRDPDTYLDVLQVLTRG